MRFTYFRGLARVTNWVRLKFAAMNLKKYVLHRWLYCFFCVSCLFFGFRFTRCLLFKKPSFFFYERWFFRQTVLGLLKNSQAIFDKQKPPQMPGLKKTFQAFLYIEIPRQCRGFKKALAMSRSNSSNWYNENAVWQLQTKTNRRNVK